MKEFRTLSAFSAFLNGLVPDVHAAEVAGLDRAATMIQREAKEELGHYQGPAGPFAAWEPLAASTQRERAELGFTPDDPELRTGHLRDNIDVAQKWGITHHEAAIGVPNNLVGGGSKADPIRDIGEVAVDQELGTDRIPPRSFLGGAAVRKTDDAVDAISGRVVWALRGLPPRND